MAMTLEALKREIVELAAPDKAEILRLLVSELSEADKDVEEAWLREAQRRHQELRKGSIKAIPANLVFEKGRDRIRG